MAESLARLVDNLAVPAGSTLYSQAAAMQGANAVQATFVVYTMGGSASLVVTLEAGNDMSNWSKLTDLASVASSGYYVGTPVNAIAFQYVRLKLTSGAGGAPIVTADVSTAHL